MWANKKVKGCRLDLDPIFFFLSLKDLFSLFLNLKNFGQNECSIDF
jgi:hypothetical protein